MVTSPLHSPPEKVKNTESATIYELHEDLTNPFSKREVESEIRAIRNATKSVFRNIAMVDDEEERK